MDWVEESWDNPRNRGTSGSPRQLRASHDERLSDPSGSVVEGRDDVSQRVIYVSSDDEEVSEYELEWSESRDELKGHNATNARVICVPLDDSDEETPDEEGEDRQNGDDGRGAAHARVVYVSGDDSGSDPDAQEQEQEGSEVVPTLVRVVHMMQGGRYLVFSDSDEDDTTFYCLGEYPSDDPTELMEAGYIPASMPFHMYDRHMARPIRPSVCIFELSQYARHDTLKTTPIGDHVYCNCVKCTAIPRQTTTLDKRELFFKTRARWVAKASVQRKVEKLAKQLELKTRRSRMVVAMALELSERDIRAWEDRGRWEEKARKQVLKEYPSLAL